MPHPQPSLAEFKLTALALSREAPRKFGELLIPVIQRVAAQQGHAIPYQPEWSQFAETLWQACAAEGWPEPLRQPADMGAPGTLDPAVLERVESRMRPNWPNQIDADFWARLTRQMTKMLLLPEFRACRQSFQEVNATTDTCPRQQLSTCRERVSGSHCVDCPYFVAMEGSKHRKFLQRFWEHGDPAEFEAHASTFLPEDVRRLRRFLYVFHRHR